MASAADTPPETIVVRPSRGRTALKWTGITLGVLLLVVVAFIAWINSDPGRRFVVRQINNIETATGLGVEVGRIEGSVFGELVIHDLALRDPQGVFFRAPRAELDYRPFAYLQNFIDIRSLVIPEARLYRLPQLRPGDPDAPLLPDIDVDIGRLQIGRLLIDPAVTGQRHLLSLDTRLRIDDGLAKVALGARTIAAPGLPGGDRLALLLEAVPEQNRLDIGLRLAGPGDGLIAGLAGVDRPIAAQIDGRGDWARWQGRARAMLGGEGLADLAIGARNGTFTLSGPVRPGLVVEGPVERLLGPITQLNLVSTFEQRRADLRLRLNSPALAVAAEGLVDLGENRFQDLRVAARLLQPGAIAPNLGGTDVQLALVLDGAFATPGVAYDLRARALRFGTYTAEGLRARGAARVRGEDIVVPVAAQARRISGLDPQFGGLLTNVTLNGDLGIAGTRIVSDNLRIRSDRINATAAIAFDISTGSYLAALQGRVNNYLIDGVGLIDLETDLDITNRSGGFGLSGRIAARTRRIDNASVRDFLGGMANVAANVAVDPSGTVRLDAIRLSSPQLRVTSGSGTYRTGGAIDLRLSGVSQAYGPLTVFVTGTIQSPQVRLRAASPGFGIGLRDVEAEVRATAQGWAVRASGQSSYGPFEADVAILSGRGPLTIQVNRLLFAGLEFAGRIVRSPAGPFVGTLTLTGQGMDGTVRLSAAGRYQQVDVAARANGARIPGDVPVTIQRAIVDASIILFPDAPQIAGDVQVAGLRSDNLSIERARARIDYRGGNGRAQLVAAGSRGVPFQVALNAALSPDLIRAAARGRINEIPFRFAQPAVVRNAGGVWHLDPVRLVVPQGQVRLAGRWGDGLIIQARLDNLDISIVNAFSPNLGLGGRATGSLDFAQPADGSFPRAEARLNFENFTRTGIGSRSAAVNIAFAGSLVPQGGQAAAVIRRGGAIIGRIQARLQPLGPHAGTWVERLLAAPLQGGIRYNGPAEVLTSLAYLPGHELSGPIGIAADFTGRVQQPHFNGVIRSNALTYFNAAYGTRITNLAINGRFDDSRLEIVQLTGRAGEGSISGRGTINLASAAGFPMDIRLALQNAQLARSDDLGATATGNLAITNGPEGARIEGELELPEVRYQFVRQAAANVPQLTGVRRRGEPIRPPGADEEQEGGVPSIWELDLRLVADNRVFVSGMGLESEWSADLRVEGTTTTPRLVGDLDLIRGTLSLAGRRFEVEEGNIFFTGARPPNPQISVRATSDIDGVEVAVNIDGSSANPRIAFSSTPGLPQDEIVSRILFGSSITEISALQAVQVAASLSTLSGGGGGLNPLGQLRAATGIDRLRILGADDTTGRGTAVAAGMYLSDDIYIELITDARGFTATQIEIALSRTLSILSRFGTQSGTNVNLRYSRDY